jgi:hypothetical protein
MARINTVHLAAEAAAFARRAGFVQQDPPVRKAWKLATADIHRAWNSTAEAVGETRASWYRSGNPFGYGAPLAR